MSKRIKTTVAEMMALLEEQENQPIPDFASSLKSGAAGPAKKLESNLSQSEAKPTTKLQQTPNKPTTRGHLDLGSHTETYNKPTTEPTTQPPTNSQQTYNKVTTNRGFLSLVGLQQRLVIFVYDLCRKKGDKITEPVSCSNLALACETTTRAAQETIRRLEKKGVLRRAGFKNGRGGWTSYELPREVYDELFQLETSNKLTTKLQQTPNKPPTQPTTEPTTSPLSSSSLYLESKNLKTTTTGEAELFSSTEVRLAPDWSRIDFSALEDIGFGRAHVVQLAKARLLTAEEVQDSIRFFAFDLARNKKRDEITKDPLSYLMGILRNGPYNAPANYESPEQAARRAYVESKRRLEEKRLADEIEIRDLEFADWRRGLTADEMKKLIPEHALGLTIGKEAILREHFNDEIWPSKRANVPGLLEGLRAQVEQEIQNSLSEAT